MRSFLSMMCRARNAGGQAAIKVAFGVLLVAASALALYVMTSPKKDVIAEKPDAAFLEAMRGAKPESVSPLPPLSGTEAPLVKSVVFTPARFSSLDAVQAEVRLTGAPGVPVSYEYEWIVNGTPLRDVSGNSLPAGRVRKNDRVSVVVTPIIGGSKATPFQSMSVTVQSAPPSLDMKVLTPQTEKTAELQLVGADPEGGSVTYAFESPVPAGVSIDKNTGKVLWNLPSQEKRVIHFSASATNADGVKTVRTFEVTVGPR